MRDSRKRRRARLCTFGRAAALTPSSRTRRRQSGQAFVPDVERGVGMPDVPSTWTIQSVSKSPVAHAGTRRAVVGIHDALHRRDQVRVRRRRSYCSPSRTGSPQIPAPRYRRNRSSRSSKYQSGWQRGRAWRAAAHRRRSGPDRGSLVIRRVARCCAGFRLRCGGLRVSLTPASRAVCTGSERRSSPSCQREGDLSCVI